MKNSFHLYNTVYQCWFNRIRKFFKFFFYYCPLNFKDSKNVWLER